MHKYETLSLILLIVISLAINLFVLVHDEVLMGGDDSHINFLLAKNLLEGKGYVLFGQPHFAFPPLKSTVIALFFKLFGISEFVASMVSITFSSFTLMVCYLLIKYFTNSKTAFLSTLLLSMNYYFVYISTIIKADIMFMFFLTLFILLVVKGFENNKLFYLAAVIAGIGNLTKLILGPLFFLTLIYLFYKKQKIGLLLSMFMIFALINSPWMYRNYQYHGNPLFSEYNAVFTMYQNPTDVTSSNIQQAYYEHSRANYKGVVFRKLFSPLFFKKIFLNTLFGLSYFLPTAIGLLVLFLTVFNLLTSPFDVLKKQDYIFVVLIYVFLLATATLPTVKIFSFASPIFLMWAVEGIFKIRTLMLYNIRFNHILTFVLIGLIFHSYAFTLMPTLIGNRAISRFQTQPLEGKEVGLWMKTNLPDNANIMAMRMDFNFYGEKNNYYKMPLGNMTNLLSFSKSNNINYVIFDQRNAFYWRPEQRELLYDGPKEGFGLVYKYDNINQVFNEVYVWKIM